MNVLEEAIHSDIGIFFIYKSLLKYLTEIVDIISFKKTNLKSYFLSLSEGKIRESLENNSLL